jgi:hypothetical protein
MEKHFKKSLYFMIAFFWVIGFNSCKKCTSCEVKDSNGNTIQEPTKTCGSTTDIENVKTNAQVQATSIGGSFECVDEI